MYFGKKLISQLLLPLPLACAAIFVGLGLLWFTARQRTGKILVSLGFGLLLASSFAPIPDLLLGALEDDYRPLRLEGQDGAAPQAMDAVRWIVVLGGGHTADQRLPPTAQLGPSALARLTEGLRLLRHCPAAKLVLSGAGGNPPHAQVMGAAAQALGVARERMVVDPRAWDTEAEARFLEETLRSEKFVLVSSAWHLPRAVALFRKRGMDPIPAPTDYWAADSPGFPLGAFFPRSNALGKLERAAHEYLGIGWSKLRGRI